MEKGDKITVKVGGVEYQTEIVNGVQRFVENPRLVHHSSFVSYRPDGQIDYNAVAIRYQTSIPPAMSQREYAEWYMASGYSVCGFADLSSFEDMEIENPLWEPTPSSASREG